jgi:CHASE2 domain-containing sensor protein
MQRDVTSGREWTAFAASLWRTKVSLAVILAAVSVIHMTGLSASLEWPALDAWQRLLEPRDAPYVRVVAIDDDDFRDLFGSQIPLRPDVMAQLVDVIARAHPLAIGVDITTSTGGFAPLADRAGWGTVVWARNGTQDGNRVVPDAVLGGRTLKEPARAGIALAAVDNDAVIRRIPRVFETSVGPRVSFHWAIVESACAAGLKAAGCHDGRPAAESADRDLLVNLYRRRLQLHPMSARTLLQIGAGLPADRGPEALQGRIVLLGGTFRAGKDIHQTPIGEMAGVQMWAHAIETELGMEGVEEVGAGWLTLADAGIAVLMIWLHHFVGGRRAFVAMIVVVPLLMIGLSLALFRAAGLLLTFGPIVIGIIGHQLLDDFNHLKKRRAVSAAPAGG